MKTCKNARCKKGDDGKPITTPAGRQYCSKHCLDAASQRRKYDRLKRGVKLRRCEPCGGTGRVEVSA